MDIMDIKVGDKLKCIFNQKLPDNEHAPKLELNKEYECKTMFIEGEHIHIGVGLDLELNYVRSYATKEELPPTTHWCHPNRFIKVV